MQLELPTRDESDLERELVTLTGAQVQLTITDNSRTVMSMAPDREFGGVRVRLHRMFLDAGPDVVRAVAAWVKRPKSRLPAIDGYIRENRHRMRRKARRTGALRPAGAHFDLRRLFDEVNAAHFGGTVTAAITWGKRGNGARRRQRTIRFGSYTVQDNLVRLHPALDQAFVPEHFVRYIVFHEMLHAHLGIEESETGRRRIHTREFVRIERTYPDYAKARAWEAKSANIRKLLTR
jgi:predicted SprT family Zn-dependent metalloprotease